jgi:hypothetical protein
MGFERVFVKRNKLLVFDGELGFRYDSGGSAAGTTPRTCRWPNVCVVCCFWQSC